MTPTALDIAADCEAIGHAVENGYTVPRTVTVTRLRDALDRCIEAEDRIPALVAAVKPAKNPDNQIELDAKEWQREILPLQIHRAARAARERKEHLATLRSDEDWEAEKIRCGKGVPSDNFEGQIAGIKHWFRYWSWALDPRQEVQVQPFVPFGVYEDDTSDFQWRYICWLHETTFIDRTSGVVEKARDMGATLGWLLWGTCCWLFLDNFSALLMSLNEDLVDHTKNGDTLFEKIRFVLRLQPAELLPAGFSLARDMSHMNIYNPENGSLFSGQAPTPNAGRQKRSKCILKDESAAWPQGGYSQARGLSEVSRSHFDVSSVQGKFNQFANEALKEGANKFTMDWTEHPWKDHRWYNALPHGFVGKALSSETIAQEVDRNYEASQPGRVFKDWTELYTCIEWPELLEFYAGKGYYDRFVHIDGTLQLPEDWEWARMQDKGETDLHPRVTLYAAVPGKAWPLSDSIFFFIEHQAATGDDLGTVVNELATEQQRFNINAPREPQLSLNSHEAKKEREIYFERFNWQWETWDTDYDSGIGNIRLWLKLIDTHRENPIRPQLMGRSRIYFVCDPGQATLKHNDATNKLEVGNPDPPDNHRGFARLRREMPMYHYPPEELGKPVQDQRPLRFNDDAVVCVRAIAVHWGPTPKEESEREKMLKRMAKEIRPGAAAQYEPHTPEHDQVVMSQLHWQREFEQERADSGLRRGAGIHINRRPPTSRPKTQK